MTWERSYACDVASYTSGVTLVPFRCVRQSRVGSISPFIYISALGLYDLGYEEINIRGYVQAVESTRAGKDCRDSGEPWIIAIISDCVPIFYGD